MDNFSVELSVANLQFVPLIVGLIQIVKQNAYLLNILKEWLTLISVCLGILFVVMSQSWVMTAETLSTGISVGLLACGSYDVIKNVVPKLLNPDEINISQ